MANNPNIVMVPDPDGQAILRAGLRKHELLAFPGLPDESEDQFLGAYLKDAHGQVCAGIEGRHYWDGVEIDLLWVAQSCRRQGMASRLLVALEKAGQDNGAGVAFLKTYEARKFYESQGYEVFGVLEGRPNGSKLYHMKKRLMRFV